MGFKYELGSKKQLVYEFEDSGNFDAEQLDGLLNNSFPDLLPVQKRFRDGVTSIYYDISAYDSLDGYMRLLGRRGTLGSGDVAKILIQVANTVNGLSGYLFLNKNNISVDEKSIFIDLKTLEIKCIYVPAVTPPVKLEESFRSLVGYFSTTTSGSDEMIIFSHKLNQYLDTNKFEINSFIEMVKELSDGKRVGTPKKIVGQSPRKQEHQEKYVAPVSVSEKPSRLDKSESKKRSGRQEEKKISDKPDVIAEPVKQSKASGGSRVNIILGQILIVIILGIIISSGVLSDENGNLNIVNLSVLALIVVGGGEYLIFKLLGSKKETSDNNPSEVKSLKKQAKKKGKENMVKNQSKQDIQQYSGHVRQKVDIESSNADMARNAGTGTVIIKNSESNQSNDNGRTMILKTEKKPFVRYKVSGQQSKMEIKEDPFLIGRDPDLCNLLFENNKAVGRIHARIEKIDNQFFLIDEDSKNFSYVNGEKLEKYVPKLLKSGDKITLADVDIVYEIM